MDMQLYTRFIFAQRVSTDGCSQGDRITVYSNFNTFPRPPYGKLGVARDAAGNFVVTWAEVTDFTSALPRDIFLRRFAADGTARDAAPVRVNTTLVNTQEAPAVAMKAGGDFCIAWQSRGQDATEQPNGLGVFGRLFNAAGTPLTGEVPVNTTTAGDQQSPSVAATAGGGFLVTWDGPDEGTGF